MPLQLTLDGRLQLRCPVSMSDCDMVLEAGLKYAQAEAEACGRAESQTEAVNRIGLAVLSVHSDFDATVALWQRVLTVDWLDTWQVRQEMAAYPLVQYPRVKARALAKLVTLAFYDGVDLRPPVTMAEGLAYRDTLRKEVWGLAWAKASYAAMLTMGEADVCCIDTHMYRLFEGRAAQSGLPKGQYLDFEQRVRDMAIRHGCATSVAQHALWDAMRGVETPLLPRKDETNGNTPTALHTR